MTIHLVDAKTTAIIHDCMTIEVDRISSDRMRLFVTFNKSGVELGACTVRFRVENKDNHITTSSFVVVKWLPEIDELLKPKADSKSDSGKIDAVLASNATIVSHLKMQQLMFLKMCQVVQNSTETN